MFTLRGYLAPPIAPEWRRVLLRDPCVYCGAKPESLDHIQPLAHGGANGWPNRAPACHRCNGEKGHATLLMFLNFRVSGVITEPPAPYVAKWKQRRDRPESPLPKPLLFALHEVAPFDASECIADATHHR
jgi:hypothetical protein